MTQLFEALSWIGALYVAKVGITAVYKVLLYVYAFWLHNTNVKKFGEWAVVTGATDGIGKAYATALAKKGMKVVLISRNAEKLENVAAEIREESASQVEIRTIAFNFDQTAEAYSVIAEKLKDLDIGVLVNNVGISYDHPQFYLETKPEHIESHIRVNIISMNVMTRIVLSGMVERKRGAIINLSSISGCHPVPLLTVYSATKAYVDFFSRALQQEYAGKGIIVQDVMPGFVATLMAKMRPSFTVPTAKAFVKQAINTIGVLDVTHGYWTHNLVHFFMSFAPSSRIFKTMVSARARAIKKLESKKN